MKRDRIVGLVRIGRQHYSEKFLNVNLAINKKKKKNEIAKNTSKIQIHGGIIL